MIAYDVLWKFSWYGEYRDLRKSDPQHISLITLGSPLGNETVKRNLKGSNAGRCSPISSPDRYLAQLRRPRATMSPTDETLADDYRKKWVLAHSMAPIDDQRLYNLAVRHGQSNPHHGTGYLIHPTFIDVLADWLAG